MGVGLSRRRKALARAAQGICRLGPNWTTCVRANAQDFRTAAPSSFLPHPPRLGAHAAGLAPRAGRTPITH